jgi:hypothetical protein
MKLKNAKFRWVIDALLFVSFLLAFFLDLTGLTLHQFLGVFIGLLCLYHLIIHWDWVRSVASRLTGRTSRQSREYFLLDAGTFAGFVLIIFTGLVISSWFNLPLTHYDTWLKIHILSSLATLGLLGVKLVRHWNWIQVTARKIVSKTGSGQVSPKAPSAQTNGMVSRREFLRVVLPAGALTLAAAGLAVRRLASLDLEDAAANPSLAYAQSGDTGITQAPTDAGTTSQGQATSTPVTATDQPTLAATPIAVASAPCVVRCNRGCSYPGRCRRYTDSNNNNRCDLGECL